VNDEPVEPVNPFFRGLVFALAFELLVGCACAATLHLAGSWLLYGG
jgi:hypothetical protein